MTQDKQTQLKKDFSIIVEGSLVRFKKDEILTKYPLNSDFWITEDGRSIKDEQVQQFKSAFKPL